MTNEEIAKLVDERVSLRLTRIATIFGVINLIALFAVFSTAISAARDYAARRAEEKVDGMSKEINAIVAVGRDQASEITKSAMSMSRDLGLRMAELEQMRQLATNSLNGYIALKHKLDDARSDNAVRIIDDVIRISRDPSIEATLDRLSKDAATITNYRSIIDKQLTDIFARVSNIEKSLSEIQSQAAGNR